MKRSLCLFLALAGGILTSIAQPLDLQRLSAMKANWKQSKDAGQAMESLMQRAGEALKERLTPFIEKSMIAASGDKHDYVSMGPYWWPDPAKPDGLPYIRRDGQRNPESEHTDRVKISALERTVGSLTLAWYFTGDEKYAEKAVGELTKCFLDPRTRMNPNFDYAQMIPGHNAGKGRDAGLIDGYSFIEVVDCIALLGGSEAMDEPTLKGLKQWFADFADWYMTSPSGRSENDAANNHGLAYDVQLTAYLAFSGRDDEARRIVEAFPARRLFTQIEPDGSQPRELARTIPMHYSLFNLDHMMDMEVMARRMGLSVLDKRSADGRGFAKAMDYVAQYLGKPRESFPYPDLRKWEDNQRRLYRTLSRSVRLLPDPELEEILRGFDGGKEDEADWRSLMR